MKQSKMLGLGMSVVAIVLLQAGMASAAVLGEVAYTFDNVGGTSVPDDTGNGNTGTLQNGATTSSTVPFPAVSPNSSASFDGTDDFLDGVIASNLQNMSVDATIEAHINPDDVTNERWLWRIQRDASSGSAYYAARLFGGQLQAFFGNQTGVAQTTVGISTGQWTHIAVTYEEGVGIEVFVNGLSDATATWAGTATINEVNDVTIGAEIVSGFYDGLMDEFRISAGILSDGDILTSSQNSLVPEPATVGLLGFGLMLMARRDRRRA